MILEEQIRSLRSVDSYLEKKDFAERYRTRRHFRTEVRTSLEFYELIGRRLKGTEAEKYHAEFDEKYGRLRELVRAAENPVV